MINVQHTQLGKIPISVLLFSFLGIEFFVIFPIKKIWEDFFGKDFFFLAKNSTNFAISWKNKFARDFIYDW
jgi:hypothetical protein